MVGLVLTNSLDPVRSGPPEWRELRTQLVAGLPGFATVLAATYAAFYTRFSSQWAYIAEVYNSIKATQYSTPDGNAAALAEWKAGFIEDCEDLHLARKPSLATTIHAWGAQRDVQQAFADHAVGGRERLSALLRIVAEVAQREPGVVLENVDDGSKVKGS
jgi:hypothetical protein